MKAYLQSACIWLFKICPRYLIQIFTCTALLFTQSTWAQLEEVIVTAQKREQNLQDISISVEQIGGDTIRENGLVNIEEILKNVPSVIVVGTARGAGISVRGTGFDLPPQVGEAAISLNTDGAYSFRSESGTIGYYDLDRIEVLRGPQGTLYGRNATGGVMNVFTADPVIDNEVSGHGTLEIGDYDLIRGEAAANIPVNDNSAIRIAFAAINRDGYLSDGHNDAVGQAGRIKYLYNPNDDFRWVTKLEMAKVGGHGPGTASPADFSMGTGTPGDSNYYRSIKASMQFDISMGPGVLTFIPSYQKDKGYNYSAPMGPPIACPTEVCLSRNDDPNPAEATSVEARYASAADSDIDWVVGVYYYDQEDTGDAFAGPYTGKTKSKAVFGQATVPMSEALRLVGGIRNSWDDKSYESAGLSPPAASESSNDFDWKAGIEFDVNDASLLYVTLSDAHRPGGFNILADDTASIASPGSYFRPEKLRAYEIGSKNRFMDEQVQLNASVFYYDYQDYHLADIYSFTGGLRAQFVNGDARIKGAEVDLQSLFGEGGMANVAVTYLDNELLETVATGITNLLAGDRLSHSPEIAIRAGLEYSIDLGDSGTLTPRLDVRYTDDQYVNAVNNEANLQKAYTTGDASLVYRTVDDKWALNFYIKNVNDEVVKSFLAGPFPQVSAPRTYGLSVNTTF